MGRKRKGNIPVTRRISPAYVAMLEQLEAAGFDLEAVIASAHSLLWTAATHVSYDPFGQSEDRAGVYSQMAALMSKEFHGEAWVESYNLKPENFRPFDETYLNRIRRNMDKHRAYLTYLHARREDQKDQAATETAKEKE